MAVSSSLEEPVFRLRGVHLDLKGVPPTFERLLSLLDVFVAADYNVVLVEWEDAFPWTVDRRFRSETAYTPQQVRQFMAAAEDKGLEVIPLVQCIGHMETPLSLPEYAPLREVPRRSDVLNPLAAGAGGLVRDMVDDVLALCPGVRYLHLGGDEAWTFGTHPDTSAFVERYGRDTLYLRHVQPLLDHLADRHIRPLLWHDMMIDWSGERLADLARHADVMVWGYGGHPDSADEQAHFHRRHIDRFKKHGLTLWCAGAFKGAEEPDADLPDFNRRQVNAMAWADIHQTIGFEGIVATGWSRFHNCSAQTCPMDASLDCLVNLGHIFRHGQPMPAGVDGCESLLERIGERGRFRQCRDVMRRLSGAHQGAWKYFRLLQQQRITVQQDPRRRSAPDMMQLVDHLRQQVVNVRSASDGMRRAFSGLIPPLWIDRYLAERVMPLEAALEMFEGGPGVAAPEEAPAYSAH